MKDMQFMPMLQHFLLERGVVYTVRKYKMENGLINVSNVGTCRRTLINEIHSPSELELFVPDSGFHSVDSWWNAIRKFVPNIQDPIYLYEVEKIEHPNTQMTLPALVQW